MAAIMYILPVNMPMEAHRVVAPPIPNVGARSVWVVKTNPQPLYLRERVILPAAQECGSVRMGLVRRKTLASNRTQTSNHPARCYTGPHSLH